MKMDMSVIKSEIYQSIVNGEISTAILKKLQKSDSEMLAKECELWDYKKTFEDSQDAYLKTLKSIISFHNTYGGYIIYGVDEVEKDSKFIPCGVEKSLIDQQILRGKFDKYFGQRLDLTYEELLLSCEQGEMLIGLLHIPQRNYGSHTVAAISNGVNSKNKNIFDKDAVYFRKADECRKVVAQKDFEFIVSSRDYNTTQRGKQSFRKNIIEHNLPDKNYICPVFVGRFEIIQELWSWLSDEFQYAKVLAADGGKGKTSIAYEFSQLLITSGTNLFEQVIWLTAKEKQYKAFYDTYVKSPETHYQDLHTLLIQICLRTGSLSGEIQDYTWQQLQRTAKDNLITFPSFIIIDDVDSNSSDEQRRIMEVARSISNTSSRILLTTRMNNIYSSDSSISVPGLTGDDYIELIASLCKQLKLPGFNEKNIGKIESCSEGSPLFTESILRLCKLGMSLDSALLEWEGKSGEAVREAALRKEVSELPQEAIKVLLTISYADSCSRSELHQYTDLENFEINQAIEQLGNLFLINGEEFIESEPRFETSSSIARLALSISNDILPNADKFLNRVKEIALGLEANLLPSIPEVGAAIKQCNALLTAGQFQKAKSTVNSLLSKPKFGENCDLYFMLAKTIYEDPNSNEVEVRKIFTDAFIKGQRKPVFFEMWYQVEVTYGSKNTIFDVCENALKAIGRNDSQWCERAAFASFDMSKVVTDFNPKIKYLVNSYSKSSLAIKSFNSNSSHWIALKDLNVTVVDEIWNVSKAEGARDISAKAIINALNNGDIRSLNFNRLIEVSNQVNLNKSKSEDNEALIKEVKQCLEWACNILKSSKKRELLYLEIKRTFESYVY